MKTQIHSEQFPPFSITVIIETHEEFKELYSLTYDSKLCKDISKLLSIYSDKNKVSV